MRNNLGLLRSYLSRRRVVLTATTTTAATTMIKTKTKTPSPRTETAIFALLIP